MMRVSWIIVAAFAALVVSTPAQAATPVGDWPCVQRKMPEISLASVWTTPEIDDKAKKWRDDPQVVNLVQRLAARRTSQEEIQSVLAEFKQSSGSNAHDKLLSVVFGLFETVNAERSDVVAGLERFGRAQKDMAAAVRDQNARLSDIRSDTNADPAKVAQLTEQLQWNLRIFDERQKSVRYVCEVPGLIEQRLFAVIKKLQEALKGAQ